MWLSVMRGGLCLCDLCDPVTPPRHTRGGQQMDTIIKHTGPNPIFDIH